MPLVMIIFSRPLEGVSLSALEQTMREVTGERVDIIGMRGENQTVVRLPRFVDGEVADIVVESANSNNQIKGQNISVTNWKITAGEF